MLISIKQHEKVDTKYNVSYPNSKDAFAHKCLSEDLDAEMSVKSLYLFMFFCFVRDRAPSGAKALLFL